MRIYSFDTLPSTQKWLVERVAADSVEVPCAVIAEHQTEGVGSRGNAWVGRPGNFFASVAMPHTRLPGDLPIASASIYFAYMMKMALKNLGSETWVKWPNDLYVKERKIGGCITVGKGKTLIAGIGVNIVDAPRDFGLLDVKTTPEELLQGFLEIVEIAPSWKQIFSNFSLEFENSKNFSTHIGRETLDLREAVLQNDGSLLIGNRRVVNLR